MEAGRDEMHQAVARRQDHDGRGHDFRHIINTGESKSHFGNVYNNVYADVEQTVSDNTKAKYLMDALEFGGMTDRLVTVSPACANTCSWILQEHEYITWQDRACRHLHNGVLWIKGNAGTGKSTLMRYIHDHAQSHSQDNMRVAFFFNGRSPETLAKSTEGMYRSLTHQLYERVPRLKMAAAHRLSISKPHLWSIEILEDLFREAVFGLKSDEEVTCHVDALDECEIVQVRSAIEYFDSLSQSATLRGVQFLLCFSSRHYPQITMRHHEEIGLDTLLQHWQDIECYINRRFLIRSAWRNELQAEIQERCSGIFLWVVLIVQMLKELSDSGATRSQLHQTLASVPDRLDLLFASVSRSADGAFVVAMRWVLFAEWSLATKELYCAIMVGTGQLTSAYLDPYEIDDASIKRAILHASRGLIEPIAGFFGERVQFIHESIREYLLSGGLVNMDTTLETNLRAASHARIVKDCLDYLRLFVLGGLTSALCGLRTRPLRHTLCPLSWYAWKCLFTHYELAFVGRSADLPALRDFPTEDFIVLHNRMTIRGDVERKILPTHSAALLSLLIMNKCEALATAVLKQSAASSDVGIREQTAESQMPTALRSPTKIDLTTLCGGYGGSPLHDAVLDGRRELVLLLLKNGADTNLAGTIRIEDVTKASYTPLACAIMEVRMDMVHLLLDHGARIDELCPCSGLAALHWACLGLTFAHVQELIRNGEIVHQDQGAVQHHGFPRTTPLHFFYDAPLTYVHRHDETHMRASCVKTLLSAGANVNITVADGATALMIACQRGKLAAVQILLRYGADLECRSGSKGTALDIARRKGRDKIVDLLLAEKRRRAAMPMVMVSCDSKT